MILNMVTLEVEEDSITHMKPSPERPHCPLERRPRLHSYPYPTLQLQAHSVASDGLLDIKG